MPTNETDSAPGQPKPKPSKKPKPSNETLPPRSGAPDWDAIDQAGWESFPASDPPAVSAAAVSQSHGGLDAPPLSPTERHALLEALDHAHRAWSALDQQLRQSDSDPQLADVLASQQERVEAIRELFRRHGLEVPDQQWVIREAAVAAEEAAHAVYERLSRGTDRGDVLCVYQDLLYASENHHLPALRATRGPETS